MGVRQKKSRSARDLSRRLSALQDISLGLGGVGGGEGFLGAIVEKASELLGCDGGSLYLTHDHEHLVFEVAINKSIAFEFRKALVPLSHTGLATYCYKTGATLNVSDVYKLSPDAPYSFDPSFDRNVSYRTRSVLVTPLRSSEGEILGVLQLVNKKKRTGQLWPSQDASLLEKMPHFNDEDERLVAAFASIASASIENALLYKKVRQLFDSFVRASVLAIDSRDPGTRGHSERVGTMTVELAKAVSDSDDPAIADLKFSERELEELMYAGLLHDFGKIAVREATFQKEEKLTSMQKFQLRTRIENFQRANEIRLMKELMTQLSVEQRAPNELDFKRLDRDIAAFRDRLEATWTKIESLCRPSILTQDRGQELVAMKSESYTNFTGEVVPLLNDGEFSALSIQKGCLTDEERHEIESHVTHSYIFLNQIPWTKEYKNIPEIAYAHHELMDGTGYPRKISGTTIMPQSRIMTICDIFDALASNDRPYKKALPNTKVLDILESMVKQGKVEGVFLKVFREQRVWECCYVTSDEQQASETLAEPQPRFYKKAA